MEWGRQWNFQALPQGYFHRPTVCYKMVTRDLEKWIVPEEMAPYHYIDDVMLTCDDLSSLSQAAMSLQVSLKSEGWEVNTNEIQGPGQSVKFLGIMWLGKTKVIPETVIDKSLPNP